MRRIIATLSALIILLVSVPLSLAQSAPSYSIAEIGSCAYEICTAQDSKKPIPQNFKIAGDILNVEECFQLITDAVLAAENKQNVKIELADNLKKPLASNGNNLNIYAEHEEYISMAKSVSNFMARYGRVPNYGTSRFGKISYETMLVSFARVLKDYLENGTLPSVVRLKYLAPFEEQQATETEKDTRIIGRIPLMNTAERIGAVIKIQNKLPKYIMLDGIRYTMPELYYAFAKLVMDFSAGNVGDIEIVDAQPGESNGENLKDGSLSRGDYISVARAVLKEVQENGMVPSYCETPLGEMGMESGIYFLSEIIKHYKYRYYLPDTFAVTTWKTLTGEELPLPVETATPTPRPTPTPYIGKGAMEGDEFETGAVGVYGAVSSASKFASQIGLDILKAGGNAVDAAVATIFAVGLCEPSGSSVGGGGLSVIYLAEQAKYIVFDYMSQTPSVLNGSGRANKIAIPGIVHGAISMLEKYGTMSLKEVLAPTIKLAREGFEVTSTMAYKMTIIPTQYPYAVNLYRNETSDLYSKGDIYKNPDLADTLELIANRGIEGFYNSEFTDMMCDYLIDNGSSVSKQDFANYTSLERVPLTTTYRGYKVYAGSGTAQGGSRVIGMLNSMSQYDLAALGHDNPETVRITATAFGVRPVSNAISILKQEVLDSVDLENCDWYDMKSTTMLTTYDRFGNMVASNNTLGDNFGSAVAVPGTGFCFNSGMNTSTGKPSSRIQSTMAPVIVAHENGLPMLAAGSPGNSAIITATAITVSNVIDFGMNVSQAINAPRFYGSGSTLTIENRYSRSTLDALRNMGYSLSTGESYSQGVGCVSAIYVDDDGTIYAGADYRREYMAYAY
ncbi:MAG: gamma-glutamyltransferase [Clostridia bacterium]|nr:gamma-glutamyltransferase [Clostridia bacterium]